MKIAIIEDRIGRMEQFLDFDIQGYQEVTIITGTEFDKLIHLLESKSVKEFDQFDCIAIHQSPLSNEIRTSIQDYCKANKKPLIFFSGGITTSVFKDKSYPLLHINSKDFYSLNLKTFIDESIKKNSTNLLILQFGEKWKLTLLLHLRNNIAVAQNRLSIIKMSPDVQMDDMGLIKRVRDLQINSLIKPDLINEKTIDFLSENEFSPITNEQIEQVKSAINNLINNSL